MQLRFTDIRTTNHEYVSVKEAALRSKLTPRTIYMWIRAGRIQSFGHAHGTRVIMGEVLAPRKPKAPKVVKKRPSKKAVQIRSDISEANAPPPPAIPPSGRSLVGLTIPERANTNADAPTIGSDNAD